MRWLTIKTFEYRFQAKECWHRWFAWHPITVVHKPDGARIRVWLVWVLRKGTYTSSYADCYWAYEYKEIDGRVA